MSRVNRPGEDNEAGDMMGVKRDGNNLGDKPLFASVLHKEYRNKKVNFRTLVTNNTDLADVPIPMSSILEVHTSREERLIMVSKLSKGRTFMVLLVIKRGTVGNHSLTKQQMPKLPYQKKTASTLVSNASSALEEANGKHMDDLVDDTQKKIEAPLKKTPRKTSIWSGREADSPK
ncbi:hypothetical protein Tco_1555448 [Tanacetum coccineum]